MVELTTVMELDDVKAGFLAVGMRADRNARMFFREVVPNARADIRDHQKQSEGSTKKWPARSPASIARAKRMSRPRRRKSTTRRLLGKLPQLNRAFVDNDGLKLRNRVPWSRAHQLGAQVGNGAVIPAREFWYWSRDFPRTVERQLRAAVLKVW